MQSKGKGYDIYHANDGDEITDSDHKGEIRFGETTLTGGVYDETKGYYGNGNIEYHLNGDTLIVKNGSKSITINNYSQSQESLGIKLEKPATEYAILCDTTGSMSNIISSVKAQAINIINSIFAKDPNARIGVFGYNDPDVQTFTHLTNDKSAVISAINSLYASAGGDYEEMLYHGCKF